MDGIREYIQKIAFRENLTLKELAERLGYKSKTSFDRLLKEDAAPAAIGKLEQAVQAVFSLTPDEKKALHEAARVTIYGADQYLTAKKMWDFVQGVHSVRMERFCVRDGRSGDEVDLESRYAVAGDVRAVIINCQYVSDLFLLMKELLQRGNAEVEHYMYVDRDNARTVSAVNALMPVFYERGYRGYVRRSERGEDAAGECGLNGADMAAIGWQDENGRMRTDLIWFSGDESGALLETEYLDKAFFERIGLDACNYAPIKRTYFECSAMSNYVKFSADYAELERGRSIWKIKPDIGVDQIPMPVLESALLGGSIPQDEQFNAALPLLEDVYKKRYKNTYSKRKHAFMIYKLGAMRRFAQTGRTTDHFWGMRAYTPTERLVILSDLLKQQNDNPYVHMYFLKDDATLRDVEIACYEDVGMLVLESDTDYNLAQGHSEIMVTHAEMMRLYREFFMNVLVQDYVYPETETAKYLRKLIDDVREAE